MGVHPVAPTRNHNVELLGSLVDTFNLPKLLQLLPVLYFHDARCRNRNKTDVQRQWLLQEVADEPVGVTVEIISVQRGDRRVEGNLARILRRGCLQHFGKLILEGSLELEKVATCRVENQLDQRFTVDLAFELGMPVEDFSIDLAWTHSFTKA